jgi:FkbM family methyltransferase
MPPMTTLASSMFGPIEVYQGDLITKQINEFGNHTRPEFNFAVCALDSGDSIFDIGAHIGTFTMRAQLSFGKSGRALCVEGTTETFELLQRNILRLGLSQCEAVNAIVSSSSLRNLEMEPEQFANPAPLNTGGKSVIQTRDANEIVVTIDALIAKYFEPNYLKLDIEGCEAVAIMDSEFVRTRKPILYFEVNVVAMARFEASIDELDTYLRDLGYLFFINIGPRNARFDGFKVKELASIVGYKKFFDVLAVAEKSRHAALLRSIAI